MMMALMMMALMMIMMIMMMIRLGNVESPTFHQHHHSDESITPRSLIIYFHCFKLPIRPKNSAQLEDLLVLAEGFRINDVKGNDQVALVANGRMGRSLGRLGVIFAGEKKTAQPSTWNSSTSRRKHGNNHHWRGWIKWDVVGFASSFVQKKKRGCLGLAVTAFDLEQYLSRSLLLYLVRMGDFRW